MLSVCLPPARLPASLLGCKLRALSGSCSLALFSRVVVVTRTYTWTKVLSLEITARQLVREEPKREEIWCIQNTGEGVLRVILASLVLKSALCFPQKLFVVVPNGITVIGIVVAGDAAPYRAQLAAAFLLPGRIAVALLKLLTLSFGFFGWDGQLCVKSGLSAAGWLL